MRTKPKPKAHIMVLGYLLRYKAISRHRAYTHFEVFDLPQVIHRLKKIGYKFKKKGKGKDLSYTILNDQTGTL